VNVERDVGHARQQLGGHRARHHLREVVPAVVDVRQDVADDADPLTVVDRVRPRRADEPAADAHPVVDAVLDDRCREARAEAELVEPVEVVDVERGEPLRGTGVRSEREPIDHHPEHRDGRLELIQGADRGVELLGRHEVGVAWPDHRLEDGSAAHRVAHEKQGLRDEALVVHRHGDRIATLAVGHPPRHAPPVRAVEVAERVRGEQSIGPQEGGDLVAVADRAGANSARRRDRHSPRPEGQ
jgi:hypothetical protein